MKNYAKRRKLIIQMVRRRVPRMDHTPNRRELARAVAAILGRPVPVDHVSQYSMLAGFAFSRPPLPRDGKERKHPWDPTKLKLKTKPPAALTSRTDPEFIASTAFLETYEWRRLRMVVLKKRGPRCECCGATRHDGVRIHVDHIKSRRQHPELALTESNLQVLCEVCNHGKGSWDETDWRAAGTTRGREGPPAPEPVTVTSSDAVSARAGTAFSASLAPRLLRRC